MERIFNFFRFAPSLGLRMESQIVSLAVAAKASLVTVSGREEKRYGWKP